MGEKMERALALGAKQGLEGQIVQFGAERFVEAGGRRYTFNEFYAAVGMGPEPLSAPQGS